MPNTYSAMKRDRVTERRTQINRIRRSRMRTQIRKFRRLLAEKKYAEAEKAIPATFSIIDRAAKWGVIKKNTAARYKSRLTLRLRSLQTAA